MMSIARRWSLYLRPRNASLEAWSSCSTWLTTMRRHGTFSARSAASRRLLSLTAMTVGMVTITNSVVPSARNRSLALFTFPLSFSSLATCSSCSFSPPRNCVTMLPADPSIARSRTTLPSVASTKSGSVRRRRVCPVGAVSKTTRVKSEYSSLSIISMMFETATASSTPGGGLSISSPSCRSLICSTMAPRPMLAALSIRSLAPPSRANARNSSRAASASTCMPYRGMPAPPSVTGTGRPPLTSWDSESLRECAGSVDTTKVRCPSIASFTAREALRLVLPTPPLPPSMMYLRSLPAAMESKPESEVHTLLPKNCSAGTPRTSRSKSGASMRSRVRRPASLEASCMAFSWSFLLSS
mmetsp:Transcript_70005/g.221857  ORF Transcript_70005/g.221857 Transcript_70005/m.221857 type:complete len:356 (-) Transcript_70005:999-2066(-)